MFWTRHARYKTAAVHIYCSGFKGNTPRLSTWFGWQWWPMGRPNFFGGVPGNANGSAGLLPYVVFEGQKHMAMSSSHSPAHRRVRPPADQSTGWSYGSGPNGLFFWLHGRCIEWMRDGESVRQTHTHSLSLSYITLNTTHRGMYLDYGASAREGEGEGNKTLNPKYDTIIYAICLQCNTRGSV